MIDILLGKDGDVVVSANGDISLTESVKQAVLIRLRWIFNEWRLGPQFGFPWFEDVFIKNPNIPKIRGLIRDEVMGVEGVTDATVDKVSYDPASRTATILYTCYVGEEMYREEVRLNA